MPKAFSGVPSLRIHCEECEAQDFFVSFLVTKKKERRSLIFDFLKIGDEKYQ